MAAAPNKAEREKCWAAKDRYWECLDAKENDASKCTKLREDFEASCTKTWFKYFERRREYLKFKDKIEKEGYEPVQKQ